MEIFDSIGERLREIREHMQQTQSDFAAIAASAGVPGATRQSQAKYEKGIAMPSAAYLAAIAAEGADVLYVLTGQRNRPAAKALPIDEQMLLDAYRELDASAKKKLLASALGAGPMSNHQVSSGAGAIQIGGASRVKVNKGR